MFSRIFDGSLKPKKKSQIDLSEYPVKLALWVFIIIIALIYICLTVIYISGKNSAFYPHEKLPEIFFANSIQIILSLFTMIWAYIGAKRNNLNELKIALISTILLGLYFIQQQKNGWTEILNRESISQLSSSSSFFLIVTTIHVVHLTTGLIILFVTLVKTFDHRIHSKNMLPMDVCIYFWTFAIIIWLGFLIMYV